MNKYRIATFLARPVGLACLEAMIKEKYIPSLLMTHKFEKDGSVREEYSKFKEIAEDINIPFYSPTKDRMHDILMENDYDILLSVHSQHIFDKTVIDKARLGAYNMHPSIAENNHIKYKGGNTIDCINRAIANGDKVLGLSFHRMTKNLDDGVVLQSRLIPLVYDFRIMFDSIKAVYPELLISSLDSIFADYELSQQSKEREIKEIKDEER